MATTPVGSRSSEVASVEVVSLDDLPAEVFVCDDMTSADMDGWYTTRALAAAIGRTRAATSTLIYLLREKYVVEQKTVYLPSVEGHPYPRQAWRILDSSGDPVFADRLMDFLHGADGLADKTAANGWHTSREIEAAKGIPRRTLMYRLKRLIDLGRAEKAKGVRERIDGVRHVVPVYRFIKEPKK